jgi:hypothetical protein
MKEKDIRERIEQFLKRTARNVVVPASVGLSLAGCDHHALQGKPEKDAGAQVGDAPNLSDTPTKNDLPELNPPYLVHLGPDAAADVDVAGNADLPQAVPPYIVVIPTDGGPDASAVDSEAEAARDAKSSPDFNADIPSPPPPYIVPAPPKQDAKVEDAVQPPPVPYLLVMVGVPSDPGGMVPMPLSPKKTG